MSFRIQLETPASIQDLRQTSEKQPNNHLPILEKLWFAGGDN